MEEKQETRDVRTEVSRQDVDDLIFTGESIVYISER